MSGSRREVARMVLSMATTCALGAAVLGGLYVATDRYQRSAAAAAERKAIAELLTLDSAARVVEVRQTLDPTRRAVIYDLAPGAGASSPRELAFNFQGTPVSMAPARAAAPRIPLGRFFVLTRFGAPAGFVVEGETRGYKNRVRFLIGLDSACTVQGVRVMEHEEDPGLGAEIATPGFCGQFAGRSADRIGALEVTRDPMPEDWRMALGQLGRMPASAWRERFGSVAERERSRPIYAVTGATISSRALTDGVRATVEHFRRRWALLAPRLGGIG